jgi:hypothetical protein
MTHLKPAFLALALMLAACQRPSGGAPVAPAPTDTALPTSQPTALPTPSAAPPTATATVGPAPRAFTEKFDGGLEHWTFWQVETGTPADPPSVINSFLIFNLPAPNQWAYELYGPQKYADVQVEAKVEMRAGDHGSAGVVCRYDEKSGWYELNVYSDQTYTLLFGRWLAHGVASYTPLVRALSEKIQPVQNEIGLLCQGNTLTPFINGTQMRRRQETTFALTSGEIGISASSSENTPGSIAFDSVKVSEP